MSMEAKVFDAPNGDQFTIAPLTKGRVQAALRHLKSKGDEVVFGGKTSLRVGIDYAVAITRLVLLDWKRRVGEELVPSTAKEREDLFENRSRVCSWIVKQAEAMEKEEDKEFDVDSGN